MSIKGLNISKMKKVATDGKTSTFQHPDGHQIRILHSALPALQRKQLEQLPVHQQKPIELANGGEITKKMVKMYADGDEVHGETSSKDLSGQNDNTNISSIPPIDPKLAEYMRNNQGLTQQQAANDLAVMNGTQPSNVQPQVSQAPPDSGNAGDGQQNSQSPAATSSSTVDPYDAYQQGVKGIQQQADVEAKAAKQRADLDAANIQSQKDLMYNAQQNFQDFKIHHEQLLQDYMNNKINPSAYQENMGTGKKITTAIGLLLGGLSNGLIHQGNPAMDFLNKQIDRDIQAQKDNQENRKTLLEANQNLYHDQTLAENATRVDLNNIYSHQIAAVADQLGTPIAQAKKNQALSQFALQNNQLLQQNAMRAAALREVSNPSRVDKNGLSMADPAVLVEKGGLLPPELQKGALEEIKDNQNITALTPKILDAFDRASSANPATAAQGKREFEQLIGTTVKENEGTARQAAFDQIHKNLTPSYFSLGTDENKAKRRSTIEYLDSKRSAPITKGAGIDLNRFSSTAKLRPEIRYDSFGNAYTQGADGKPELVKNGRNP